MTTTERFDHSSCEHERTKAGRAKCRKERAAAASPESAETPKTTTPAKKAAPAAPKKSPTRAPAKKSPTKPAEPKTDDAA
ncbi:hypothetical protein [Streptomyces griseoflavus]|uniref:hypothetical protein n=1 Tax=Streptomyces griseoflavus TaxID=35619 RepID=UPI0001B4DBFE|nr:hypothetical protein [Streptomyces griseoflavus]